MSEHDRDLQSAPRAKVDDVQGAPKEATQSAARPASAETKKKIEKILKSKSNADELPRLVSLLDFEDKVAFITDTFPTLGEHVAGDVVLEVGKAVQLDVGSVLDATLTAKQKVTKSGLRRYLSDQIDDLSGVTAERLAKVRAVLTGPALDELPLLARQIYALGPELLQWFIETTPPATVAITVCMNGSEELGEKLAALTTPKKWQWVDHLHLAQGYIQLAAVARKAPDPIKQKIEAKLGAVAGPDDALAKFREDSRRDLDKLLEGKPQLQELLDAVAAAGAVSEEQSVKVLRAVRALQVSADDVLALSGILPVDRATLLDLLLASKDVSRHHLELLLFKNYVSFDVFKNASVLANVRKHLPDLSFRQIAANSMEGAEQVLLDNDALRKWFFETATPEDKLWFCGSGSHSARACKLMNRRDPSWKWVFELTAAADDRQLRAVALNCGQQEIANHIRTVLLADREYHQVVTVPADPDLATKSGETGRVLDVLAEGGDLMARLADLNETKRARYGKIDSFVQQIAAQLSGADFARAAVLLDLTFSSVVAHAQLPTPALVAYLRTRPRSEELETAQNADLVERALTHVNPDPLVVFPSLREPAQLAKAIEHNQNLIKILFHHADPSTVSDLLSRDPVVAATERALAKDPRLLRYMPDASYLSKRGREGIDRLAKQAKDEDVVDELSGIKDDAHITKPEVRDEARKMDSARKHGAVTDALEELLTQGGSPQSVMALLGEFPGDQLRTLLSEETHAKLVGRLARVIGLPPHIAFPQLSIETLLTLRNSRAWLFDDDDVTVLLDLIANRPAAIDKVAAQIDHGPGANALIWLGRLPQGAALTDVEVRTIDRMQPSIKDANTLRLLFQIRFGTSAPSTWDDATVRELYRTICRLPRSHLNQERIKGFVERPIDVAGRWNGEEVELNTSTKPTESKDDDETWHPTAHRMSKAQIQHLYGWNDLELTQQLKLGNVKLNGAADQYEVVQDKIDRFASTVLHEIGHAVDDILGRHTEAVFGDYAQWHSFMPADFDQWAAEQGGWDKVTPGDQKKIREVYMDAIRSGDQVYNLVDGEHPALSKRYEDAGVGVVASARHKLPYGHAAPVKIGDRAFVMNTYYHQFFSVATRAVDSKPSTYSLYAPAEYFAECYVEFYKEYDGTAATRGRKGGVLPQPVKNWFANHVDTLKYDPKRFEKSDEEEAD